MYVFAYCISGAANNQLLDDRAHDKQITSAGIAYVPDFLANRMGIVNCANEVKRLEDTCIPSMHQAFVLCRFIESISVFVCCCTFLQAYGYVNNDPAIYRHFSRDWQQGLFSMTKQVLSRAASEKISTAEAANQYGACSDCESSSIHALFIL
jgi:hypothetical protein